jgi:hypothetical protein
VNLTIVIDQLRESREHFGECFMVQYVILMNDVMNGMCEAGNSQNFT